MPTEDELKTAERVATKLVGTRRYQVHEDQAVWERRVFLIDVPNDLNEDEAMQYIYETLASCTPEPIGDPVIGSSVAGMDTQYEINPL